MAHNTTITQEVEGVTLSGGNFETYRNLNPTQREAWKAAGQPTDLTNWYNNVLNTPPLSRAEQERQRLAKLNPVTGNTAPSGEGFTTRDIEGTKFYDLQTSTGGTISVQGNSLQDAINEATAKYPGQTFSAGSAFFGDDEEASRRKEPGAYQPLDAEERQRIEAGRTPAEASQPLNSQGQAQIPQASPDGTQQAQQGNTVSESGGEVGSGLALTGTTPVSNPSVVDFLNASGLSSDINARGVLANKLGIPNYQGTAEQNTEMLSKLRAEQASSANIASAQATPPSPATVANHEAMVQQSGTQVTQQQYQQNPPKALGSYVSDIMNSLGMGEVGVLIEHEAKEIEKIENKKDREIRRVNDDPWLTEGVRLRQIEKINEKYSDEIGNKEAKLGRLQKDKELMIQQSQWAMGTAISLWDMDRRFDQTQAKNIYDQSQDALNWQYKEAVFNTGIEQFALSYEQKQGEIDFNQALGLQKFALEQQKAAGEGGVTVSGQYSDVINNILASGKFTKDQSKAIKNAIANGDDPLTVIKNNARSIMGQTIGGTVLKYETAQQALSDIDANLQAYYNAGGTTNIFAGSYEKVLNKLGEVNDPNLVNLATQIAANLQVYRNAVSGTAYSEQEGADIASIFPGINKTQGLNDAILAGRQQAFDSTIDASYRSVLGSGYDQLKQSANPPQYGPVQPQNNYAQETQGIQFTPSDESTGILGAIYNWLF